MKNILIVEDDEISAMVLTALLSDEGFSVANARDYDQALQVASESPPQILISDWQLDGVRTGGQIAEELRGMNPGLEVIFITGREKEEVEAATGGLKVRATLTKPCNFDEVVSLVKTAADGA